MAVVDMAAMEVTMDFPHTVDIEIQIIEAEEILVSAITIRLRTEILNR